MDPRFSILICSREGDGSVLVDSKFSTERSPVTALLCDGKKTVSLPIVSNDSSLLTEIVLAHSQQLCRTE